MADLPNPVSLGLILGDGARAQWSGNANEIASHIADGFVDTGLTHRVMDHGNEVDFHLLVRGEWGIHASS